MGKYYNFLQDIFNAHFFTYVSWEVKVNGEDEDEVGVNLRHEKILQ